VSADDSPAARTCLITGANSGIGKEAARRLVRDGARVILVCRSRERGEAARRELETGAEGPSPELVVGDLERFESVREAAAEAARRAPRLDALVANAGVYRAQREITPEGLERTMAVNHVGHFLLVGLLLDRVVDAAGRIVVVSSEAHRAGRLRRRPLEEILRGEGDYSGWQAYADSKLANLLFAFELGRRLEGTGVGVSALHPGTLATSIWNRNRDVPSLIARVAKPFMGSPERGGERVARLVTDPDLAEEPGVYFSGDERSRASEDVYDRDLAEELWEVTDRVTGTASGA